MIGARNMLPSTKELNIGAFSRMFDDTTTSYKHLFISALLNEFRDEAFATRVFNLEDLAYGMLAEAWYPTRVFMLSLGVRDQAADVLARIALTDEGPVSRRNLKSALAAKKPAYQPLMRWVPYRALTPFFSSELRGVPDSRKNELIASLASDQFHTTRPLYRLAGRDCVELHPDWAVYIMENFPIVAAWAERHWISYLQARNPTVPAISEKAGAPRRREALSVQTQYWKRITSALPQPMRCLYSSLEIDPARFHLDHFLPWTFVCHDALWNLLPVDPGANSAKGNRLPDRSYIQSFAATQHMGLTFASKILSDKEWKAASDVFVGDLRISKENLLDLAHLRQAYEQSLGAQLSIARSIGFEHGWNFAV